MLRVDGDRDDSDASRSRFLRALPGNYICFMLSVMVNKSDLKPGIPPYYQGRDNTLILHLLAQSLGLKKSMSQHNRGDVRHKS